MYRGTSGSEVAYLLRNLLHRLGLTNRPEQVRFLAASASLEPGSDDDFLEGFFAAPSRVVRGRHWRDRRTREPAQIPGCRSGRSSSQPRRRRRRWRRATAAVRGRARRDALVNACTDDGSPAAKSISAAGQIAVPRQRQRTRPAQTRPTGCSSPRPSAAADLQCAGARSPVLPKRPGRLGMLRSACAAVAAMTVSDTTGRSANSTPAALPVRVRRTGARPSLLPDLRRPVPRRFTGGHLAGKKLDRFLLPDVPDLESLPTRQPCPGTRPATSSTGRDRQLPVDEDWDRGDYTFEFKRSRLDHGTGHLRTRPPDATGWSFHVRRRRLSDSELISPFPIICPSCGDDWEMWKSGEKARPVEDQARTRSPVRTMRTGFEKVTPGARRRSAARPRWRQEARALLRQPTRRREALRRL